MRECDATKVPRSSAPKLQRLPRDRVDIIHADNALVTTVFSYPADSHVSLLSYIRIITRNVNLERDFDSARVLTLTMALFHVRTPPQTKWNTAITDISNYTVLCLL